ncbi:hypothetical protein QZR14_18305 [Pseudomonas sp. rhizo66]|uniref:hypothetical protein n=1 Tax=Pseudomonas sp. rhizo66 TaxID=3059674 RepID=UPI00288F7534|nr:hypothetical protein [Pseudomonas sp. rhizo66]MDT3313316.1 hypothetical protein [Pseudomonas sp. rhizo66]
MRYTSLVAVTPRHPRPGMALASIATDVGCRSRALGSGADFFADKRGGEQLCLAQTLWYRIILIFNPILFSVTWFFTSVQCQPPIQPKGVGQIGTGEYEQNARILTEITASPEAIDSGVD